MSKDSSTAPLLVDDRKQTAAADVTAGALVAPENSPTAIFERLASNPNVNVENLERLMALFERNQAREAELAYNAAMSAAQKEMRPVAKDASNPQTRSRYASYEALDTAVRPIYTKHGFGLSYDTGDATQPEHVRVLCKVTHSGGHSEVKRIDMPADGKGAKGGDVMTKTHATASAVTYGMRNLLKMVFNISVGEADDDGNAAGGKVAPPKPPKYDDWFTKLQEAGAKGLKTYEAAWECSEGPFKDYAVNHDRDRLKAIKVSAAQASKGR